MLNSKLNDQELVSNYVNGNEQALAELVERHKRRVMSFIKKYINEQTTADDIFQDTFFKVVHTLKSGKYNEEGRFLPWVTTIAHNLCIDYFRHEKKMPSVNKGQSDDGEDSYDFWERLNLRQGNIEDKLVKMQKKSDLKAIVALLPQEQKEIIILRLYKEMSFKEISEMYNISINTALGRMRYALINLRKIIDEKNLVFH